MKENAGADAELVLSIALQIAKFGLKVVGVDGADPKCAWIRER